MSIKVDNLIAARDLYLKYLSDRIAPILHEAFKACATAVEAEIKRGEADRKKPFSYSEKLRYLQKELAEVPEWGRTRIAEITSQVLACCSWLRKVVRMIFGSHVVILTCVNHKPEDVTLDLPTDQEIVHGFLIETAARLTDEPWILIPQDSPADASPEARKRERVQRKVRIKDIMRAAIDDAIKNMVPFELLADHFLSETFCKAIETHEEDHAAVVGAADQEIAGAASAPVDEAATAVEALSVSVPAPAARVEAPLPAPETAAAVPGPDTVESSKRYARHAEPYERETRPPHRARHDRGAHRQPAPTSPQVYTRPRHHRPLTVKASARSAVEQPAPKYKPKEIRMPHGSEARHRRRGAETNRVQWSGLPPGVATDSGSESAEDDYMVHQHHTRRERVPSQWVPPDEPASYHSSDDGYDSQIDDDVRQMP